MALLRDVVKDSLRKRNYQKVLDLAQRERRLVRTILSLLYEDEQIIRWRAVTMIGKIAAAEPDKVRPLIGRFVWWMNNESGGIGWSSAPALGEIGLMAPELLHDTVRVVCFYRAEPFLLEGVLWAIGRLKPAYPDVVGEVVPDLIDFLGSQDAKLRGQAAWSLGEIGDTKAVHGLENLRGDREQVWIYDKEELMEREVGQIAAASLARLQTSLEDPYRTG